MQLLGHMVLVKIHLLISCHLTADACYRSFKMGQCKYIFLILIFITSRALALDVAVVGAGASGLTAAHYLKKQGHTVTIFEKNDRVGGKVRSFKIDGITIELGGVLVTNGFSTINSLIRIYGPRPQIFPSKILFQDKNKRWRKFKGHSALGPIRTLIQVKKLLKMYQRFPELNIPQLVSNIHPDLFLPLDKFAKKYGFYEVLPPFIMSLSASGYLYPEVTPAYYALKLFRTVAPVGIRGYIDTINPFSSPYINGLRSFKNGYSELWNNMASHFNVKLNERVLSIGNGELTTTKSTYRFDKVIISTDVPTARSIIMKPSTDLEDFTASLTKHRFLVTAIRTKNLKGRAKHSFFFYPNMTVSKFNSVLSMVNFWNNDEVYVAYQNLDDKISLKEAEKLLVSELSTALGIVDFEVLKKVEWSYFHHIPPGGYTPKVAQAIMKLQGQDDIYFVGESLNFESTESAAQNAKWVVEKFFR